MLTASPPKEGTGFLASILHEATIDDQLQATTRQKTHNDKMINRVREDEEYIRGLHHKDYENQLCIELENCHKKANVHWQTLEGGLKWTCQTLYDNSRLLRDCGCELTPKDLQLAPMDPHLFELSATTKELQEIAKMAKEAQARLPIMTSSGVGSAIETVANVFQGIEDTVRHNHIEGEYLAQSISSLLPKILDCCSATSEEDALREADNAIQAQWRVVDALKAEQNKALTDGEVVIAEEASYQLIVLIEKMMELVGQKFGVLHEREENNAKFKAILSTLSESNAHTLSLKQTKRQLKRQCEGDIDKINKVIAVADVNDKKALQEYAAFAESSVKFIENNEAQQKAQWTTIFRSRYSPELPNILADMRKLGEARYEMINEMVDRLNKEEARKVEYMQFLEVAIAHKNHLESGYKKTLTATTCIGKLEQSIRDICLSISSWHLNVRDTLANHRVDTYKEHLECFREVYLCVGNLLYKKEKKIEEIDRQLRREHIQLEFCIETFDIKGRKHGDAKKELIQMRNETEEEVELLRSKAEQAMEDFIETEEVLKAEDIDFLHPVVEFQQIVMVDKEKMLQYKAHVNKKESVKMVAEREEVRRLLALNSNMETPDVLSTPPRTPVGAVEERRLQLD